MDDKDLPDLDAVDKAIKEAHDAEESLLRVSPNAIHPDEEPSAAATPDEPTEAEPASTDTPEGPRTEPSEPG